MWFEDGMIRPTLIVMGYSPLILLIVVAALPAFAGTANEP
jgi:hypothetical protein